MSTRPTADAVPMPHRRRATNGRRKGLTCPPHRLATPADLDRAGRSNCSGGHPRRSRAPATRPVPLRGGAALGDRRQAARGPRHRAQRAHLLRPRGADQRLRRRRTSQRRIDPGCADRSTDHGRARRLRAPHATRQRSPARWRKPTTLRMTRAPSWRRCGLDSTRPPPSLQPRRAARAKSQRRAAQRLSSRRSWARSNAVRRSSPKLASAATTRPTV